MKIICKHCGSKARITHSRQVTDKRREFYIQCLDYENCGARYVADFKYLYDIIPPKKKYLSLLDKHLSELPPEERTKLMQKYV